MGLTSKIKNCDRARRGNYYCSGSSYYEYIRSSQLSIFSQRVEGRFLGIGMFLRKKCLALQAFLDSDLETEILKEKK